MNGDLFRSPEEFRVHFLIEERAHELKEFVEAEFESLRRSVGQRFRWLSYHNRRSQHE